MEVTYGPLVNPSDSFDSVASSLWLELKFNGTTGRDRAQ